MLLVRFVCAVVVVVVFGLWTLVESAKAHGDKQALHEPIAGGYHYQSRRAAKLGARPLHPPPPLWMPCASLVGTQKTRLLRDTDLRVCRGPITTASRLRRRRAARRLVGSIASAVLPPVSSFILGFLAPALGFPEPDYYYLRTTTAMASALMPF